MADTDTVLVTGAAGQLGRAVAARLAHDGWRVAALDRDADRLHGQMAALPGTHIVLGGVDLLDAAACADAVERVLAEAGRLDGLAHTVGGFAMGGVGGDGAEWDAMLAINLRTTRNLFRAVVPPMRRAGRGAIVAVGAMPGLHAPAGLAAYAASKAAVMRLVESTAAELRADGVRANAVLPSTLDTPPNRAAMPDADPREWVTPAQVAAAIGFLLSEDASGITGALLPVAGRQRA